MSSHAWNTSGSYTGSDNDISCPVNNYTVGGTGGNSIEGTCYYALPTYSTAFGQLDAGVQYQFDDHFSLNVQTQNLLNAVAKTTMGVGAQNHGRSWFISDRRITVDLSINY
jgi:iron complex outermembrane recepter protein